MCANTLDLENATLEEIKAGLDPDFVPEGWLDRPLLLRRSSSYLSPRRRPSVQVSYLHRKLADLLLQFPRRKSMKLQKEWCQRTQRTTLGQRDAWVQEWNQLMPLDPVPTDLLQCHDASVVSKYLRYFVLEARTREHLLIPFPWLKTKRTVILCPWSLQLVPFLVLVFPKHFSSFLNHIIASRWMHINLYILASRQVSLLAVWTVRGLWGGWLMIIVFLVLFNQPWNCSNLHS